MPGVWTPKAGHVPRPARRAVRGVDRERPRRGAAGHALRLFAAGQPRADGHRAGAHRSARAATTRRCCTRTCSRRSGWTAPRWACAPTSRARHVRPDMRGTVPIKHLSRNSAGRSRAVRGPGGREPRTSAAPRPRATCTALPRCCAAAASSTGCGCCRRRCSRLARQVHTGDMPNQLYKRVAESAGWIVPPANQGIGFQVRGTGVFHHLFGTLASPETHRQLRRGQHDVLGRSGCRRQLRAVQRRGDDPGAPTSNAARS